MTLTSLRAQALLLASLALSSLAGAQTVTIYGRVDLGLQYSNRTGASGDAQSEVYNGGIRPSIWGFKGSEDLGDGLQAFFNLEAHLFADTGISAREGQAFRRQSNLGLKGGWGTFTIGRQYSPALLAHLGTEPRAFKEQFSGLYPYALNQNGNNPTNDLGIFIGNALSYSGTFGPVNAAVAYALGEQSSERDGRTISAGLTYTGPVVLSASYQRINDLNSGSDGTRHVGLGAALPLGAFTIKTLAMQARQQTLGSRVSEVRTLSAGVDWAVSGADTATLAYYHNKDRLVSADRTDTLVVSLDHALSKRTTLYAQLALADADAGATARTTVIAGGSRADARTTAVGVGISHSF